MGQWNSEDAPNDDVIDAHANKFGVVQFRNADATCLPSKEGTEKKEKTFVDVDDNRVKEFFIAVAMQKDLGIYFVNTVFFLQDKIRSDSLSIYLVMYFT